MYATVFSSANNHRVGNSSPTNSSASSSNAYSFYPIQSSPSEDMWELPSSTSSGDDDASPANRLLLLPRHSVLGNPDFLDGNPSPPAAHLPGGGAVYVPSSGLRHDDEGDIFRPRRPSNDENDDGGATVRVSSSFGSRDGKRCVLGDSTNTAAVFGRIHASSNVTMTRGGAGRRIVRRSNFY